ncbi:hypothetical protein [Bacillus sp. S/N-304-OC-R1]|uniref:hypothetical protein n=1 Tax=Bacillus sp. S/N-304-OC-R1 TaxID=2758034 RepID=UPI001C8D9459|nr:hypothetical protein [Bacillus sp. S/N-304-OC-R1]MBY0120921.1 hypothetical protein [Bacillus sp. S/N-304-OC-R1]
MLKELSSSLMDDSIYHIIEFNDGTLSSQATFFVVNINEFGFVKADIIFPQELDAMNIIPMVQRIHYHRINLLKPATTDITEKVRINVVFSEYTKQIILEADDQCWYIGVDKNYKNFYHKATLKLLLFMQALHNGETRKVTYPTFYEAQYRYLNHIRRHRYKSSFKSEEEKEAYKKWEMIEYQKCSDKYFHLLHYSHPKRYENDAETFEKWAKETETRNRQGEERNEERTSTHSIHG